MLKLELFKSRMGRKIEDGQLVGVHWNAHKNCWSIVEMKSRKSTGVVLGYAKNVTLEDVTFLIVKSKQKIVRETGTKERHAFIVGKITAFDCKFGQSEHPLYYNPHKVDTFVDSVLFHAGKVRELKNADKAKLRDMKGKPFVTYEVKSWDEIQLGK